MEASSCPEIYASFKAAFDRLRFTAADGAMLAALANSNGWKDLFLRRRPEALEVLRTLALVESSESSNCLEIVDVPRDRVEALSLKGAVMLNRSEQKKGAGYRDALPLITRVLLPFAVGQIERHCHGVSRE